MTEKIAQPKVRVRVKQAGKDGPIMLYVEDYIVVRLSQNGRITVNGDIPHYGEGRGIELGECIKEDWYG